MDAPLRSHRVPRWMAWTLAAPLGLGLALGVLAWQRGDVWKARALEAINRELAGELNVTEMSLSWWNGFPDVSVDLSDVALVSPDQDTLIFAQRIGLELGFWSLWGDAPELSSVVIEGGNAALVQGPTGSWNVMDLLAERPENQEDERALSVGQVTWRNADLTWSLANGASGTLHVDRAAVELPDRTLPLRWDVSASKVTASQEDLPDLRPVEVRCTGSWTTGPESGGTCVGELEVEGVFARWNAKGLASEDWSAHVQIPKITQRWIESIWTNPPWKDLFILDHSVSLDAVLTPGSTSITWTTERDAFQISPHWTGLTMAVQGVCSGTGTATHEFGAWSWTVEDAHVSGTGWAFDGSVRPTTPGRLRWEGTARLDASTPFAAWIPNVTNDVQSVLPVSGTVTARGSVTHDVKQGLQSMLGTLSFSQLTGMLDGQPYLVEVPELRMESTTCSGHSMVFQWAGNVAEFDAKNITWASLLRGGPVAGDLHVRATTLRVDPMLTWWEHLNLPPSETAILLPAGSSLGLHVDSDEVEWDALRCTNLTARTKIDHNRWVIQTAQVEGLEGRALVEGSLAPGRAGWLLSLRGTADDISLPKLFSTYGNFGQTLIRHDHLSGALSTAGTLGMSWGLDGTWHGEEFTASLQTGITYGRLRGLEVFEEIADYLEGHRLMAPLVDPNDLRKRLKDVAFEPVSQRIDVRAESVWLPMTVIQSSAMNVAIEGAYGFDSNIDYTLGFALRDLRASASDAFGQMEDDGLGNQFFLRMSGPVEEPVYAYDRDAAKEHRRAAIQAEKSRLREALRQRNEPAASEPTHRQDAPPTPDPLPSGSSTQSPATPSENPQDEGGKSTLLDRVRKPKDKKDKDLFNPDDDDYL